SRLAGCATKALEADRLGSAARLAERFQCVVVLKGSGTIVAAPGRLPHVNPTGNAALATGGTGDVLAGWIAGSWAQMAWKEVPVATRQAAGQTPGDTVSGWQAQTNDPALSDAFDVAVGAVLVHGAAAEETGGTVRRAADLIDAMLRWKEVRSRQSTINGAASWRASWTPA
ncbi:MAG: hypothetical protein JWQ11_2177, partial [Rhizobacter sp.]|nr:hypothetical protein [Rhizobacter sp.]